jgi:hypothetical protein
VTIDTGVLLPDVLAAFYPVGQGLLIRAGGADIIVRMRREGDENEEEEDGAAVEDVPGGCLCEPIAHRIANSLPLSNLGLTVSKATIDCLSV